MRASCVSREPTADASEAPLVTVGRLASLLRQEPQRQTDQGQQDLPRGDAADARNEQQGDRDSHHKTDEDIAKRGRHAVDIVARTR